MSFVSYFKLSRSRKDLKLMQTMWKSLFQVHILCQNQTEPISRSFKNCCLVVKNSIQLPHSNQTGKSETTIMSRVVASCKLHTSCTTLSNTEPHFNSLAKTVVESASRTDVMASSVPLEKVSELVSYFVSALISKSLFRYFF